jgi:hypothetical protein
MDYFNLRLENVQIPAKAEEDAKRGFSRQIEVVKGILLRVVYAKDGIPAYCIECGDKKDGLKYFIEFHNEKALAPLKKEIKRLGKASLKEYMIEEIDRHPVVAASTSIFAFDWAGRVLFVWTNDKKDYPALLEACSKAIVKIAPHPGGKFDTAAGKALADAKGVSAFTKLILENAEAMGSYQKLFSNADAVLDRWPPEKLLSFWAALGGVIGFSASLKKLAAKHRLGAWLQNNPDRREKLFHLLQENAANAFTLGKRGLADKEYLTGYIQLLAGAFDAFGFGVHPKGLETVIRLFENDAVEGIFIEAYQTAGDYKAGDYGYYDGIENEEYYNKCWNEIDIGNVLGGFIPASRKP